jgi:putative FmdB family regulatory protein
VPIYEFECKACGDVQEVMQKLSDPQPSECPVCHGGPLVKLMSRTGFILKGAGWYVTDFRDGGKKPSAPPSTGGDTKGAGASESSTTSETSSTASSSEKTAAASSTPGCGTGGCDS